MCMGESGGPFLENGGCRVGGVYSWGISKGVPINNFVRVNAWTSIAQTIATPNSLAR